MFDKEVLLRNQGINYEHVQDELNFDCPFCTDTRRRFFWNTRSGLGWCHNCEWRGDAVHFVGQILHVSRGDALRMVNDGSPIYGRSGSLESIRARLQQDKQTDEPEIAFPEGFRTLVLPENESSKPFWRYVRKRGIPAEVAMSYELGYTRLGKYSWRVIIPVYWFGKLVSWVGRDITGKAAKKALTPPGNQQSHYLLNLDRLWGKKEIVLVEGPFDMLKLPDVAVASFGKRLHAKQEYLLKKAGIEHVIICYDNDALASTYATADRISEMFRCSVVELPDGEDPGSLPAAVTKDLIYNARAYRKGMRTA